MVWRRSLAISGPLAALLIGGISQHAHAWGTAAHRQICELAWDDLSPSAEGRVREVLGVRSQAEFAELCVHPEVTPADLMTLPDGARELDMARDCPEADSCPVREIEMAMAEIKEGAEHTPSAILRLVRFAAEVHQPLSVGYAADRNGLLIDATFLGRPTNMHEIWSNLLVAAPQPPRRADTGFELRVITNYLDRARWTAMPPLAWAQESYWIMRTPATGYVGNPGGLAFDEVFVAQNKLIVMDQLEKAGVRLGHLLNTVLGDQDVSLIGPPLPNC